MSLDRMGAYCPVCKQGITESRTHESSPLISAVARLSAENAHLRTDLSGHIAVGQALVDRINELEAENAVMREIVKECASLWLTVDQSEGASHTLTYLYSRDGDVDVEALRETARAQLASSSSAGTRTESERVQ